MPVSICSSACSTIFISAGYSRFVAPSTTPTILYRLLKNVYQSLSTFCSDSGRSFHSGLTSSAFRLVFARARDASCPAKTGKGSQHGSGHVGISHKSSRGRSVCWVPLYPPVGPYALFPVTSNTFPFKTVSRLQDEACKLRDAYLDRYQCRIFIRGACVVLHQHKLHHDSTRAKIGGVGVSSGAP